MNDRQENKLTMYRAVETLLDNNAAKTGPITALATAITNFKNLIGEIETAEQEKRRRRLERLRARVKQRLYL